MTTITKTHNVDLSDFPPFLDMELREWSDGTLTGVLTWGGSHPTIEQATGALLHIRSLSARLGYTKVTISPDSYPDDFGLDLQGTKT